MSDERQTRERRTQADRSATTQTKILQATLECIGEFGVQRCSLTEIADRARISKGAITHHFSSKTYLCAEAIAYFSEWRRAQAAELAGQFRNTSAPSQLRAIWGLMEKVFPISFEIMVALRADAELRGLLGRRSVSPVNSMVSDLSVHFSDLSPYGLPGSLMNIVFFHYQGLRLEAQNQPAQFIDDMRREFDDFILECLSAQGKAA